MREVREVRSESVGGEKRRMDVHISLDDPWNLVSVLTRFLSCIPPSVFVSCFPLFFPSLSLLSYQGFTKNCANFTLLCDVLRTSCTIRTSLRPRALGDHHARLVNIPIHFLSSSFFFFFFFFFLFYIMF